MRAHPEQVCAPRTVLDQDQRVDALEQHGIDVHEVNHKDAIRSTSVPTATCVRGVTANTSAHLRLSMSQDSAVSHNRSCGW